MLPVFKELICEKTEQKQFNSKAMVTTKLELHPGCSGKQGGRHLSLEA